MKTQTVKVGGQYRGKTIIKNIYQKIEYNIISTSKKGSDIVSGIYFIRNLINNKTYIGKTSNFKKRFEKHINQLNNNTHKNRHLQNSWNIYGQANFEFIIFKDNIDKKELSKFEKMFISIFETNCEDYGYNLTNGGEGVDGYKHNDNIKKLISQSQKGTNNTMYGRKHSEESIQKISEKMKVINKEKGEKFKTTNKETIDLILNLLNQGYTQLKISEILKIPQPKISRIKNGKY